MATISSTVLNNTLRNEWMNRIVNLIIGENPDDPAEVLQVSSSKLAIPVVDSEGNEKWVTIAISVPKGSRDGDEFDGYAEADSYKHGLEEKEQKQKAREEEKKRKEAEREAKKAEREAKKKKEAEEKGEE